MKIGFMTACLPELSFEELVKWASENGFDVLEVACWPYGPPDRAYAGVTHIDVSELSNAGVAEIRRLLDDYGLGLSSLGYYPNYLTSDKTSRDFYFSHLKKVIDAACFLEVEVVGTFIGRDMHKTVEDNLRIVEEVWPPFIDYAEKQDVKIAIENCPMQYPEHSTWPGGTNVAFSPPIWRKIFEMIPSRNLGLNYDPSHLIWQGIDYIKPIREFRDKIFHTHAKDTLIERELLSDIGIYGYYWHVDRLPGLGDVDWRRFIAALHEIGYIGAISIEHEDKNWQSTVEKKKEGLLLSKRYLKNFF
ncbi:MAG: sugar phosphate isomerase/epimerase [Candidatus Bathyarchaeia archaeon]